MSHLTENPELMLEVLAVLVRNAGGTVSINRAEAPGPFNIWSKLDGETLHLTLDETVTHADVAALNGTRQ